MTQQYQQFRKAGIIEEVGVRTASISASNGNSSYYVCLQDIQDVFPDAQRFKLDEHPILFLQDSNGNRIEPPCIAFYPDKILDVITDGPQVCNNNSSSNSSSSSLKTTTDLILETKENAKKMLDLLLEAKKKDDEMLKLQQQVLDRLAILIQNFELHEYPIPRLFIVLPVDTTKWDPRNILRSKFRLHFLCECGEHTATISKSNQNQIHIAKHEGYDIRNSTEFFRKYGKYMLILLHSLKMGMPLTASLVPTPNLDAGIDYSIKYMEALPNEYPVLSKINKIGECEALEEADLRQLGKFLQNNDEDKQLGNLYSITTETGHVKWVCFDHYRSTYREAEQKAFEKVVELNGGEYDLHLGKVTIILKTKTTAEEFFNVLTDARRVYELDISFDWNWSKSDLEAFEEALKKSSVSILRLELGEFQESTTKEILSMAPRYGMLVHIIELSSMKAIHIVLPPNTIKAPSLRLSRPPHLQKLTIEMKPREIDAILELSEALKTNKTLTTLDLMCNRIGKEGALALLEALKTNTTLITLDMEYDSLGKEGALLLSKTNTTLTCLDFSSKSIGDEGALALSEALKINTTLTTLNLRYSSIGKKGALALSDALKTNTTLSILRLRHNLIGKEGALALSEALKANTSLTTLDLFSNAIGKEGALALSEALKANATLTTLDLRYNSIGNKGTFALSEALKANASLTTLDLRHNSIGDDGALALSEALKVNTTLTTLNLHYNSIGKEGVLALSEALKTNATLTKLDLRDNSIGKEEALALSEVLKTIAARIRFT
ncbi:hypothetical protein BCR41DRAFT_396509 [Lobosporangium transversale]|uniref:Uncharacterized protein n=1 Tax=Lobosporangium transversale TaxID=64571 RepID=A0A1Y2GMS2_9FUNG|nr:hypothetical protein BCR41DRAFT_396509 [Lobosporangium transversale]ORZ15545.1 hypothetical protein BCR41DRAFT_396509 [Lobosporangium transversale]|eukprot:XP_021881293.1 hypothetical protein BCR41DRAFT_396509 [Lobosporangium transversale]